MVRLFEALSGQWRLAAGSAVALDYAAVPATAVLLGLRRRELPDLFDDLRVLEAEALRVMNENQ